MNQFSRVLCMACRYRFTLAGAALGAGRGRAMATSLAASSPSLLHTNPYAVVVLVLLVFLGLRKQPKRRGTELNLSLRILLGCDGARQPALSTASRRCRYAVLVCDELESA